jgi:hypothetical protein
VSLEPIWENAAGNLLSAVVMAVAGGTFVRVVKVLRKASRTPKVIPSTASTTEVAKVGGGYMPRKTHFFTTATVMMALGAWGGIASLFYYVVTRTPQWPWNKPFSGTFTYLVFAPVGFYFAMRTIVRLLVMLSPVEMSPKRGMEMTRGQYEFLILLLTVVEYIVMGVILLNPFGWTPSTFPTL